MITTKTKKETITDYEDWLGRMFIIDKKDFHTISNVHYAVNVLDVDYGGFICERSTKEEGKYFLSCDYNNDAVLLLTEKSRRAFLIHLEVNFMDGLDVESYFGYQYQMSKND